MGFKSLLLPLAGCVMLADLTVMSPVTVTTAYGHGMDETSPFLLLQGLLAERADDVIKESWAPGS